MSEDPDRLTPGDVPRITAKVLADRGEYLALVSVAVLGSPQDTSAAQASLNALATKADDPQAFAWWWSTVKNNNERRENWMSSATSLAAVVSVPSHLQEAVLDTLTTDRPQQARHITPLDQLKEQLFARLPVESPPARQAARAIMTGTHTPDLLQRAYVVLGSSDDPTDRQLLLDASNSSGNDDLSLLTKLTTPLRGEEISHITQALRQRLRRHHDLPQQPAATLMAHLDTETAHDLLVAHPNAAAPLVSGRLLQRLGPEPTKELLAQLRKSAEEDGPSATQAEEVITTLLASLDNLGNAAHATALWAASTFGVDRLVQYRQQQVRAASSTFDNGERRAAARARLLDLAGVDTSNALVADLAVAVRLQHLTGEALLALPVHVQRGLGQAQAQADAQDAAQVSATVTAIKKLAADVSTSDMAPVVAGYLSVSRTRPDELVDLLADPAGVAEAVDTGAASLVASAFAAKRPSAEARVAAAIAASATPGHDTTVDEYLRLVEPASLSNETAAASLATALRDRPNLLGTFTRRLLDSLMGPENDAVSGAALATVLREASAVDALNGVEWTADLVSAANAAAHVPDRSLQEALAGWLASAPLNEQVLDLVATADDNHTDEANPFAGARTRLAQRFAAQVADTTRPTEARIIDLQLTVRADAATARAVALPLLSTTNVSLRRAASELLAAGPGTLDEVAPLEERAKAETDRTTHDHLTRALRRIKSGSVAEALHNLMELVFSADQTPHPNADVLLPHREWHETFIDCVDELRAAVTTNPNGVQQASLRLGELLIEQVVATQWLGEDERKASQARQLLANNNNKVPIGALLKQTPLQEKYPWLHAYATLREDRSVHPAPAGRTTPVGGEYSPMTLGLFARVVEGWMEAMTDLAN